MLYPMANYAIYFTEIHPKDDSDIRYLGQFYVFYE